MKALPIAALVIVLAELVGAIAFAAHGSWVIVGVLAVGTVAMAVVLRALARRAWGKPPVAPSYVQRESTFF